jgi:hypothetical protein
MLITPEGLTGVVGSARRAPELRPGASGAGVTARVSITAAATVGRSSESWSAIGRKATA